MIELFFGDVVPRQMPYVAPTDTDLLSTKLTIDANEAFKPSFNALLPLDNQISNHER